MFPTIYAPATSPGKAGIAVVRISGPRAVEIAESLSGRSLKPRMAALCHLTDPTGLVLDQSIVLVFPGTSSYTGEPLAELQLHGSQAVVTAVLNALSQYPETRLAEPGEFTRRALENGSMDISQIEGLADLLDAETEAQRKQAFVVMRGGLSQIVQNWRASLIRAAALVAATIDFADEGVPEDVFPEVLQLLRDVLGQLKVEIESSYVAERIRDGFEVAIVGEPNIGKSTLLNALAGREAAITSEIAGTTRDVIEVRMDLNGLPVTFLDTAGIRHAKGTVEKIGINRAMERAKSADLRIFLVKPGEGTPQGIVSEPADIVLTGKADLFSDAGPNSVSGKTGLGIKNLTQRVAGTLGKRQTTSGIAIRERHRIALKQGVACIEAAQDLMERDLDCSDLISEEISSAITALNSLIGLVDVEDVLDEIFSSFCLGK